MPIVLKTREIAIKNRTTGEYDKWVNAISEHTTAEMIDDIEGAGSDQILAIEDKGQETLDSIPDDYTTLGTTINDIVEHNDAIYSFECHKNVYINDAGNEVSLSGYNTYFVPVSTGDIVLFKQNSGTEQFYEGLTAGYVFHLKHTNDTYTYVYVQGAGTHPDYFFEIASSIHRPQFKIVVPSDVIEITVSIKSGNENLLSIYRNIPNTILKDPERLSFRNTLVTLDSSNCLVSYLYYGSGGMAYLQASGYSIRTYLVKQGDIVNIPEKATGITYYGFFYNRNTQSLSVITSSTYTVPDDGFIETFDYPPDNISITVKPFSSFKIDYSQIMNTPPGENPYNNLTAVAFGTSLTYRSQSTQGYLTYLPDLSGMTIDNQGIGSSVILAYQSLDSILAAVKNYSGYSGKRVAILEGFVNDWYYNSDRLGTWKDTAETTVCGCVRSAINYMLSQNASLAIFLVLDHYGRLYSGTDCSSSAVRFTNGPTQYEFYEEIAKVAESLGVYVVRQYAISGISENTPQFLSDNIHPTLLGAKQSADTIWNYMRSVQPLAIST